MDYLIYSLPRCGSAWLANFLTYDCSFCYHEPLADGHFSHPRAAPLTGAVDTAAYRGDWAAKRRFALTRDYDQINESLAGLSPHYMKEDFDLFEARTKDLIIFHYRFLFDVDYLKELWRLIVNTPFNRDRAELLIEMNVQRDFDKLVRRVGRGYGVS